MSETLPLLCLMSSFAVFKRILRINSLGDIFAKDFNLRYNIELDTCIISQKCLTSNSGFSIFFLTISMASFKNFSSYDEIVISIFCVKGLDLKLSITLFLLEMTMSIFACNTLKLNGLVIYASAPQFNPSK